MTVTSQEATKLRNNGITIFSIGVGSGAKLTELNAMATDPDKTHVFTVTNFSSLDKIKGTLAQQTCNGMCFRLILFVYMAQDKPFFQPESTNIFLISPRKYILWVPDEALLISIHDICFCAEIRKYYVDTPSYVSHAVSA